MISDSPESPKRWQSTILPDKPRQAQAVVWALGKLKTIREAVSTVSEFLKCWSRPGEIYSPVKRGGAPKQLNQRQNLTFPAFRWPLSLCISTQGWVHQRPSSHSKRSGPSWNMTPDLANAYLRPGRPASPLPSGTVVDSMFVPPPASAPHSSFMTGLRRIFLHMPGAGSEMGIWPTAKQWVMMKGLLELSLNHKVFLLPLASSSILILCLQLLWPFFQAARWNQQGGWSREKKNVSLLSCCISPLHIRISCPVTDWISCCLVRPAWAGTSIGGIQAKRCENVLLRTCIFRWKLLGEWRRWPFVTQVIVPGALWSWL